VTLSTFNSLANIAPTNHIWIAIHSTDEKIYGDLDSKLCGLLTKRAPIVELEMDIDEYERARESFPCLSSKNMVRLILPIFAALSYLLNFQAKAHGLHLGLVWSTRRHI
jgi:hypothetical protein